jgi:hypothetical protein
MRAYLALAIAIVSLAGCNDDQQPQPGSGRKTIQLPSRRAEPPKPEPDRDRQPIAKVDVSLGNGFEMRHPIKDGRLTLIPIVATQATPTTKFITLHDGMQRNLVSVRELGEDWEVDTVRITNRSKETLVALSGELIIDAMQDRVLAEDTVIMAGKTEQVHVRCVEEDRDHGGTTFHAGNAMAELALRRTVVHASQESVWAKVKQINRAQKLAPPTNTYRLAAHNQTKGAAGERRDRIVAQLEALEERQQIVGLAVAIDGQVVAIQRLATPELYRQLEGELLASYMPDTDGMTPEGKRLSPDDVRALQASERGASTAASHSVLRAL